MAFELTPSILVGGPIMVGAANLPKPITTSRQIVHIVEDDELFRHSLIDLFQSFDMEAEPFEDAQAFFEKTTSEAVGCVLADLRLPGLNGIEFQKALETFGYSLPVILMSAHGDVATSVNAMKAGAVDFLQKPLRVYELLGVVNSAFERDAVQRAKRNQVQEVRDRASILTRRESQVLGLVVGGLMNKQIAFELGISEIMVKLHRGKVMRKMKAASLAELVRQFELLS